MLIVQVHRKWSGLNARPDETVYNWAPVFFRLPARWVCGEADDMCFIMSSGITAPPVHARINSESPNCPSPPLPYRTYYIIFSSLCAVCGLRIKMIPDTYNIEAAEIHTYILYDMCVCGRVVCVLIN